MNNKRQITLNKMIKVPIPDIPFSNKQVGIEIVYDAKGFDIVKATDEINQMITIAKEQDPSWLSKVNKPKEGR